MIVSQVLKIVEEFFKDNLRPIYKFISIQKNNQDWDITVEIIEEKEYMESYAKDELIGVYGVTVNDEMEITSFKRINLRKRCDVKEG